MDRLTPEIEKAYRKWSRSLAGNDTTRARIMVFALPPLALPSPKPAKGKRRVARGKHPRSPESREKMRQAALKRWAKVKRAA